MVYFHPSMSRYGDGADAGSWEKFWRTGNDTSVDPMLWSFEQETGGSPIIVLGGVGMKIYHRDLIQLTDLLRFWAGMRCVGVGVRGLAA